MNIPKNRRGGAYIMVLTVTMLVLMLAAVVLSVTAISRRLTSRYTYIVGLYDLAVSGNEQALFLMRQAFAGHEEAVRIRALARVLAEPTTVLSLINIGFSNDGLSSEALMNEGLQLDQASTARFHQIFAEEAMNVLRPILEDIFTKVDSDYRLTWNLGVEIMADERTVADSYLAITTIVPGQHNLTVRTNVRNYIDGIPGFPAVVRATIIWSPIALREIILDAYTINTLISHGAVFPTPPVPGTIIFLDEFTLAMVESLRLDIS